MSGVSQIPHLLFVQLAIVVLVEHAPKSLDVVFGHVALALFQIAAYAVSELIESDESALVLVDLRKQVEPRVRRFCRRKDSSGLRQAKPDVELRVEQHAAREV
jgi:hypothetical protein